MLQNFINGRPTLKPSADLKIIIDGNSIYAGSAGTPMGTLISGNPYIVGTGTTVVNYAVSGRTWQTMASLDGASVDAAFDPAKTNLLIIAENTNSCTHGRNGQQAFDDCIAYINARKAAHPTIRIVLCTGLPIYGYVSVSNDYITAADNLMRANYRSIGAEILIDYRIGPSIFNHSGNEPEPFQLYQSYWSETSSWIHPNTNGNTYLSQMIIRGLKRLHK